MNVDDQTLFWSVSLRGKVLARMEQFCQFDDVDNAELASEEAALVDRKGVWVAVDDSAIVLPVGDEVAVQNMNIVRCRATESCTWHVIREAMISVQTIVTVDADSVDEALATAVTQLRPELWRVCGEECDLGAEVLVGTPEVLESVYASSVTSCDSDLSEILSTGPEFVVR